MTIREHLASIEDGVIRHKALANLDEHNADNDAISTSRALFGAFYWAESPEGGDYWVSIHDKLVQNEGAENKKEVVTLIPVGDNHTVKPTLLELPLAEIVAQVEKQLTVTDFNKFGGVMGTAACKMLVTLAHENEQTISVIVENFFLVENPEDTHDYEVIVRKKPKPAPINEPAQTGAPFDEELKS